jgi:parvulin-like peptidyl-prolyl isomerase
MNTSNQESDLTQPLEIEAKTGSSTPRSAGARALRKIARRPAWAAALLACVLGASSGCKKAVEGGADAEKPVALVGADTVTVGETATYMQAARFDHTREGVERALDDLVAVELLKVAAGEEELTPQQEALRTEWERQLKMYQFRDSVIYKSAVVPDSAVEAFYRDRVGEEVKARHILVALPATATVEEKDAARARAEEALEKARRGEDFEQLSREYSEPRTAATGGDLGWFGKGDMVPAFEATAFALEPGEISDVVETRFGFHVIKVEDRRKKSLEEMRPQIQQALAQPLQEQAEDRYVEGMMAKSTLQFYEANVDTLVAIFAQDSIGELPPARRDLVIAKWEEGSLTVGDIVQRYRNLPPQNQAAVKALDRERMLGTALPPLVRNEMLMARAEAQGLELDPERRKRLDERVRGLVVGEMLRRRVKQQVVIGDSAVRAEYAAKPETYGKTLEEAEPAIRAALLERQMARVNTPEGQRELVREIAQGVEGKVEVERLEKNYELVLKQLPPPPVPAGERTVAGAPAGAPPGLAETSSAPAETSSAPAETSSSRSSGEERR